MKQKGPCTVPSRPVEKVYTHRPVPSHPGNYNFHYFAVPSRPVFIFFPSNKSKQYRPVPSRILPAMKSLAKKYALVLFASCKAMPVFWSHSASPNPLKLRCVPRALLSVGVGVPPVRLLPGYPAASPGRALPATGCGSTPAGFFRSGTRLATCPRGRHA